MLLCLFIHPAIAPGADSSRQANNRQIAHTSDQRPRGTLQKEGNPSLHVLQGQPLAPDGSGDLGVLASSIPLGMAAPVVKEPSLMLGLGIEPAVTDTGSREAVTHLAMGKLRQGGQWR